MYFKWVHFVICELSQLKKKRGGEGRGEKAYNGN